MKKYITLKTAKTKQTASSYIRKLPANQKKDAEVLLTTFSSVTKAPPRMWGTSIVGFGSYQYERSNGQVGEFLATGFSMRSSGPTIYIMPGYNDYSSLLKKLGQHTLGKSCLYLKRVDDIHLPTLKKIIRAGLTDLKKKYPVQLKD